MRRAIANLQIAFPEMERTTLSTLTVKYGTGYDVPWYACDAVDLDEARKEILQFAGMTEATATATAADDPEAAIREAIDNATTKAELAAIHKRFGANAFNADLLQYMKNRTSKLS